MADMKGDDSSIRMTGYSSLFNVFRVQVFLIFVMSFFSGKAALFAQSVILPMPRLTTTMPMGMQAGSAGEVLIKGEYLDGPRSLMFSDPRIQVEQVLDESGEIDVDRFLVTVPEGVEPSLVEARVMTRLGVSSPRAFSVSDLPEVTQSVASTDLEKAMDLGIPSICNASMPPESVCYYRIECAAGQRLMIECAAKKIESKLNAVLIVADDQGRDLVVQRRGDRIDFTAPSAGQYYIKVHELTFKGGPEYFFRLHVQEANPITLANDSQGVDAVNAFSWPPPGIPSAAITEEVEPNDSHDQPQLIQLPCDLKGDFAKAADVDLFQFEGKKGEAWWIEVASERLGRPTDVALLVQRIVEVDGKQVYQDVVELNDIPSPVKVSTNHYAYDGPPYNAGSPDILGELLLPEDGMYIVRLVDLFGGTRNDPRNVYRLLIRKPQPDFAIVGWAMHMELRNGDRNAVSKPIALRNGGTMPLEIVVIRRDGFEGPIQLSLENLPDGVTAQGIHLGEGESRGMILVTANEGAPAGFSEASLVGTAEIEGNVVRREGRLASMAWPVKDHWQEIPAPRLLQKIYVSVGGQESAPLSMKARDSNIYEVEEGGTLSIPLLHFRRSEFSGSLMNAKVFGKGLEGFRVEIPLDSDHSELTIDLSKYPLKLGDHAIAVYGGAVAKYQYFADSVVSAEEALEGLRLQEMQLSQRSAELQRKLGAVEEPEKSGLEIEAQSIEDSIKSLQKKITEAERTVKQCTDRAKAKDIVDIVVSEPIHVRVVAKDKP